ncbi:MAG TPA: glycoside hydrolase family 20 zincin-like fold domain-containing protein [Armatimonadota bacterium]|jgi:hypothetical protein
MKRLLPFLLLSAPAFAQAPRLNIAAGDMRLTVTKNSQVQLSLRGVPVFREQSVIIVRPGWNGVHLYPEESDPTCAASVENGAQVGAVSYESAKAFIRYRFELRPDNTCRMTARYGMKTPDAAEAEAHVYLNANLFAGTKYVANGKTKGAVPLLALDPEKNRIAAGISRAVFSTVLGPVDVKLEGGDQTLAAFNLDDYRKNKQEWARKYPTLWFGVGVPLMPKLPAEQTFTMVWRFRPPAARGAAKPLAVKPLVTSLKAARVPWVPDLPVIPRPKARASEPGKTCRLPSAVRIAIPNGAPPEIEQAAREIQADLKDIWSTPSSIVRRDMSGWVDTPDGIQIILARLDDLHAVATDPDASSFSDIKALRSHPHAYIAGTGAGSAGVVAPDALGVYYGTQTLKQRIRVDAKGVYIAPTAILDWPTLDMRGVHWFGGRQSAPFHKRMIERIAAPFKLNTMLYEVDYTDWDSMKQPDPKRGMSKADVQKTVDIARAHSIEPIPLITGFGNCDWMFVNGQNKDLLYRDNKRSYDPHNPKSYDLLFKTYQEAIDIFRPKYFHIGHDEITTEKPSIPPTGETETAVKLIVDDVTKVHDWLKGKNIATMMWSDELLHIPEETETAGNAPSLEEGIAMRQGLPKDTIICDWHYWSVTPQSKSVPTLRKDGFPVVGCTWFERDNIRNFARLLAANKSLGLIQTTWAGWEMSENMVLSGDPYQFVGYLIAAECAWNGGAQPLDSLGYEPEDVFRAAWLRKPVDRASSPGFAVSLSGKPAPHSVIGGAVFAGGKPIRLSGALDAAPAPRAVSVPLGGKKAATLCFVWNTALATAAGTNVADLTVRYLDGKALSVPIVYGKQIFAAADLRTGPETLTVNRKSGRAGPTAARLWRWSNPRPNVPISNVSLASRQTEAAPTLFALTGVN